MKAERTMRQELRTVERLLKKAPEDHPDRQALYGAMQALSWALSMDAMMPSKAFAGSIGSHESLVP